MGTRAIAEAGLMMLTRFPRPGGTKTRLIPALGAEGAAQLQRQMTEHLVRRFRQVCRRRSLALEVHFADGTLAQMQDWLGPHVCLKPQCEGNLGQRLNHAFEQGFAAGMQRILMVGSDCPGIGEAQVAQALSLLAHHDIVLGPAEDGGYYLIGLNAPKPMLFEAISWGQSCVLRQTIAIAAYHHLSVSLLNVLPDVDRPEDLAVWAAYSVDSSNSPQVRL